MAIDWTFKLKKLYSIVAQHVLGKKIGLLSHSFPTRHQIYVYTLYFFLIP